MGRSGAVYLDHTALALLCLVSRTSAGLWDVSIDDGPAPSPQDGPPFSAHAIRNLDFLPYQIIAIVGSYLITIVLIGTFTLTMGRKLRHRAQSMVDRPVEMIKPMAKAFDSSPANAFGHPLFHKSSGSFRSKTSPAGSPQDGHKVGFDHDVIKEHRQRDLDKMTQLYGHIYEYEDVDDDGAVARKMHAASPPPQYVRTKPSSVSIQHDSRQEQREAETKVSSAVAIDRLREIQPMSPMKGMYTGALSSLGYSTAGQSREEVQESTTGSSKMPAANPVPLNSSRKGAGKLRIKSPLQRLRSDDNSDGARTPLSPSFRQNSTVSLESPSASAVCGGYLATTPRTATSIPYPYNQGDEEDEQDEISELPRMQRAQQTGYTYDNTAQLVTNMASQRPDPIRSTPHNKRGNATAMNLDKTLPFRTQQFHLGINQEKGLPMSPRSYVPRSAGPIQTTFVETRDTRIVAGPLTGMPTPYSPYIPDGLVTPVTARLETRHQRRQRQKEEKAVRGVITEEDQVADEGDIWSSGY